jgi:hypothetical protein
LYVGFEVPTVVAMKISIFWDLTLCSPLKVNRYFGGICHLHLQGRRKGKQETSMKAGGRQSNWLAKISDYIGNRRGMEDSKSVPAGSPVGQNEPPVSTSSETQLSEPIGDKNRLTSLSLRANRYWQFILSYG